MSKIATYSLADTPLQLSDRLIGTEAPRPIPSATPLATKNFSLAELLTLFSSNFPGVSLQAVLDTGNTATQDINLTGTITTDLIKPINIEDVLGSQGTPLQVLSKAVSGVNWINLPSATWGSIIGTITLQTDLINYLSANYFAAPTGTTLQYVRGDGSLATFPTVPIINPSALTKVDDTNVTLTLGGFPSIALLESVSLTLGWTGTLADSRISSAPIWNAKQNALSGTGIVKSTAGVISYINGTTAQYVRGDGSLATFPTVSVGDLQSVVTAGNTYTDANGTITVNSYLFLNNTDNTKYLTISNEGIEFQNADTNGYALFDSTSFSITSDNNTVSLYAVNPSISLHQNSTGWTTIVTNLTKDPLIEAQITLPNHSGTLALLSDIAGGTLQDVVTAGNTYTGANSVVTILDGQISLTGQTGGIYDSYDSTLGIDVLQLTNPSGFAFYSANQLDVNDLSNNRAALYANEARVTLGLAGIFTNISANPATSSEIFLLTPETSGTLALLSDIPSLTGYVPTSRTLTINGTTYDLSADRSWTISTSTSPLTTKGDLYTRNATVDARLPIGLDTQILIADSTTATGLKWGTNTAATPTGYYGAFQDLTNQTAAAINTGYPMRLGVTDLTNGVTVVSNSRVTIANTGIYNIQWSAQFTNPTSSEHDVTIWLRKNGVDVPGSAGIVLVPPKHGAADGHTLPSWNFLLDPVAGDYYEFVWSTTNTSVYISFNPAGNPPPSTASVVLTVTQQSGIMAGTGMTSLTTTGSSGAATYNSGTGALNIPQYMSASTRRNANNSSNNNINYCGVALGTGVSESSSVWTITRLTISYSGAITIATATNVAWTNRQTATYT